MFRYTGIVGNSRSTIDDVKAYLAENPTVKRNPALRFGYVWSGCNFARRLGGSPAEAAPASATAGGDANGAAGGTVGAGRNARAASTGGGSVRLLMVSTVEPRKMYGQAVRAFNLLRGRGQDLRLDIVGREGWKAEDTVSLIQGSPYYNKSLFWHKGGIGDGELSALYGAADAVIVASKWEGFGLAVTEGAWYGKPLILRDIPIFREIAGEHAWYFSGYKPEDLADALERWLALFRAGKAPSSEGIHLTTWQEHTDALIKILTD